MPIQSFHGIYKGYCNIALYLYLGSTNSDTVLLYSWVLPTAGGEPKWYQRKAKNYLVIFGSFDAEDIELFWDGLLAGKTLDYAARDAGIPLDIRDANRIQSWVFPLAYYTYRPQCIFRAKDGLKHSQDLFNSPANDAVAYVESLFCLNKDQFFTGSAPFREKCDFLEKETGINFSQTQASRIGNVEWHTFPSCDAYERSYIQVDMVPATKNQPASRRKIKVTMKPDASGDFLINIRCVNGKAIVCDTVKEISITSAEEFLEFDASEKITSLRILIWKKMDMVWTLWYEKEFSVVRSVRLQMDFQQGSGSIESRNLACVKKDRKLLKRVEEIEKVALYSKASKIVIGETEDDPWRVVIERVECRLKRSHPEESDSMFLPKGWGGQVQFYEWLKTLPSKASDLSELIIVDPYLDQEAIRFIPRFGCTDIDFTLITDTKCDTNSEKRRANIQNEANLVCKKVKSLKLTIHDAVVSRQLIHDRYILLKDFDGLLVKGYHLSNSIESANSNFPLLITNIPQDILLKMQDWLSETLDSTKIEVLWDSSYQASAEQEKATEHGSTKYPVLTQDEILERLSGEWRYICENAFNNYTTEENLFAAADRFSTGLWDSICLGLDDYIAGGEEMDASAESLALLEYFKEQDFARVLDDADRIYEYLHLVYCIPPLYYLVELLARFEPEKLVSIADGSSPFSPVKRRAARVLSSTKQPPPFHTQPL